jgi:hypothetical protein
MRAIWVTVVVAACGSAGAPRPDGTLVASNHDPVQLTSDSSFLYWTEFTGGVFKTQLDADNSDAIGLVDRTISPAPAAIAIDADAIYWGDSGIVGESAGFIATARLDGSNMMTLVPGASAVNSIALDATNLYWTNGASVWAVPKTGGTVQRIAIAEQGASQIVVNGSSAYWASDVGIRALDLTTQSAVPRTVEAGYAQFIAVSETTVCWVAFDQDLNALVMSAPIGGGNAATLDKRLSPDGNVGGGIAIDGDDVYWTSDTAVMRVGLDGTGFESLASNNQQIRSMALGPSDVFWGAEETISTPQSSEITSGIRSAGK